MAVNYSKIKGLTAREFIKALLQDGFFFVHQKGSHHRYHHSDGRRITIPFTRPGDSFAIGTLKSIIEKQAKWTEDDLKRLELID